jgi:hypothetical protein
MVVTPSACLWLPCCACAATWERALKTPHGLKQLATVNRNGASKKRVPSYSSKDVMQDHMADL